MADKFERFYTVPLNKAYEYIRTKRAKRAVSILEKFLTRHAKVDAKNVRISNALNNFLWQRGIEKPPRKAKIRVIKEGIVAKAYLADEKLVAEVKKADTKTETKVEVKEADTKKEEKVTAKTQTTTEKIEVKREAKTETPKDAKQKSKEKTSKK
ncbi:MAG: 50S ribosomal protein L31e [Candidatus Micrarchaeota archaeon]